MPILYLTPISFKQQMHVVLATEPLTISITAVTCSDSYNSSETINLHCDCTQVSLEECALCSFFYTVYLNYIHLHEDSDQILSTIKRPISEQVGG